MPNQRVRLLSVPILPQIPQFQVIYEIFRKYNNLQIKIFKEMNNQIKTNASSGIQTTQVRYQKALKQINKLISYNNDLQEICNKQLETINALNQKLEIQDQMYRNLVDERNQLWSQVNDLKSEKLYFFRDNQELRKQIGKNKSCKNLSDLQNKKKQHNHNHTSSYQDLQKNMTNIEKARDQSISQTDIKIKKNEEAINFTGLKLNLGQINKPEPQSNELIKKLTIANSFIEKVNAENVELKSKLVRIESNRLLTAKSLPKYTPELTPRIDMKYGNERTSTETLRRLHKLQQENKRISKKYENGKNQIQKLLEQIKKLKKEQGNNTFQISKYETLINKQQDIIAQLHTQYDQQVLKMTEEFKKKLIDQRQSFSPTKNADHLKQIQSLQVENKTMKKKLQLFSTELTKCFKTLQKYKEKLSECQKQYSDLINQRNQLTQKINKLQSSHRDRSSHSRSSTTKFAIPENDRRNSMGETGHFNMS